MHRDSSVVEGASVLNSIDPVQEFQENWISQNELGEGSGLRGDDNSRSSGGGHLHIAQSNSAGGRQHDLHERHGQGGTATEEATLSSRFLSALRTFVDWGSPFHYSDSPPDFSNSSNIEELMRFSAANESTQLASSPSTDGVAMHSNVPSTSSHVHVETSHTPTRNRSRASPFCPCFSPTVSDSEEDDLDGSPAAAMSDQLRQRLAIAGSAANQLPMTVRRRSSIATSLDVPVHRIVEYSHHLVPDVDKIYAASYYWGVMDRFKAEQLLEGKPEGTFLLRDSAQTEYLFSVSFRRYQRTLHARIEQGNHRFGFDILDDTVFSSATVTGLIENYKDPSRCLFFEPQLTHPLHRNYVFSLQELCRAKIVSNTSYSLVSRLQLPPKMKNYIRDYHYTVPVRTVIKQHD